MKYIRIFLPLVVTMGATLVASAPASAGGCGPGQTVSTAAASTMTPSERESCGFGQHPSAARVAQADAEARSDPILSKLKDFNAWAVQRTTPRPTQRRYMLSEHWPAAFSTARHAPAIVVWLIWLRAATPAH